MDKEKLNEIKEKAFADLERSGIDIPEATRYMESETALSIEMGFNEDQSFQRALVSTINYYKKYLDKLGNRVRFVCLGIGDPSDYGIKKVFNDIHKKFTDASTDEKDDMITAKIVDQYGCPLHVLKDPSKEESVGTTIFEDRVGKPIKPDEEISQNLIGVIEDKDGKQFPSIVRVYGRKACDEKKSMYTWCLISGKPSESKTYPGFIIINTIELMMKPLKDSKRLSMDKYKELINNHFSGQIIDSNSANVFADFDHNQKRYVFISNARMLDYNFFGGNATTNVIPEKTWNEIQPSIVADGRISSAIEVDVDTKSLDELWLCALIRKRQPQDQRVNIDILGMYVENPADRKLFRMVENFFDKPDEVVITKPVQSGGATARFIDAVKAMQEKRV